MGVNHLLKNYEPQKEMIISAGIDIGTSTTKIVLSRFFLMNMAGGTHLPRIEIIDKEIFHQSPIFRTPLQSSTAIDLEGVQKIIDKEYREAGIQIEDVKTGAIIITGETATKKNAEQIIHQLSSYAGEFLVATAGPDLEAIIAAKGSGAYAFSKKSGKTIANIDIGGGTANVAVYQSSKLCGTCTLHIGGRLIEFSGENISYIAKPVKRVIKEKGWAIFENAPFEETELKKLTDYMAAVISRMLRNQLTEVDRWLLLGHLPSWSEDIDVIMFSGGIGECLHQLEGGSNNRYDDIGMLLAESLRESRELSNWEWIIPERTVRATVLGAGMQTTEISGATIQVESSQLPLKNLPVYQISFESDFEKGLNKIHAAMDEVIDTFDPLREGQNFAFYLTDIPYLRFQDIQRLANALLESVGKKPDLQQPFVIVLQSDHAKVLGQTLNVQGGNQPIICIDQINVEHGDYLDIGKVLRTEVVPVVVKTLTFHS